MKKNETTTMSAILFVLVLISIMIAIPKQKVQSQVNAEFYTSSNIMGNHLITRNQQIFK